MKANLSTAVGHSKFSLIALLLVMSTHTLFAQQSANTAKTDPSPTPSPATSGVIKGRVVVPGGRVPKNALVAIGSLNASAGQSRMKRLDADGRFVFDELSAGVYTVVATAPGFIDESFSARDLSELPRHLPGAQVTIRLVKGGVITGTVTNQKGDPVVGVSVRALPIGNQQLRLSRFTGESNQAETDDRGVYRIYGLPPGEYLVAAGGRGPFGPFLPTGFDTHAPTYHPSSTRDTAASVVVRAGEEAAGIDIRYRNAIGYSISGVVKQKIDKTSHVNISSVSLFDVKSNIMLSVATSNIDGPTQVFKFDGVADGEYELLATFFAPNEANWSSGTRLVTVAGADVTGVEMSLKALSSVEGSIKLEPSEIKCDKRGAQILETVLFAVNEPRSRLTRLRTMYNLEGTVSPNNTFQSRNLNAGRFRFVTRLPTDAWYLRDIQLPSSQTSKSTTQPVSAARIPWQGTGTIKPGEIIRDVVITIGQDAAGLSGSITLPKGETAVPEGLQFHLIPVDREEANNVLRYYETKVESNGQFTFSHIAPGRYFGITRLRPPEQIKEHQTPEAWDATRRAALRRAAELSKNEIELKSCQKLDNYVLKIAKPIN